MRYRLRDWNIGKNKGEIKMAGIDKIYTSSWEEYSQLKDWVSKNNKTFKDLRQFPTKRRGQTGIKQQPM